MEMDEFKAMFSSEEIQKLNTVATKIENITEEDKDILVNYIKKSSEIFGEDQISEPIRYIVSSLCGLRREDLQYLIGEDFDPQLFDNWNTLHDTPTVTTREIFKDTIIYDLAPRMKEWLRIEMGIYNFRSCAADIGYYLLEHKEQGDFMRDSQALYLLLDGLEPAAAAEYVSETEGKALTIAVKMLANCMVDSFDEVKETIWDMTRAQGEKINIYKIFKLLINDCLTLVDNLDKAKTIAEKLHSLIEDALITGNRDLSILYGIAKLRIAQNARMRQAEEEAKTYFNAALNYLVPPLKEADHHLVTDNQIHLYWNCLKVCQEMAQPKAMVLFFNQIIKIEREQIADKTRTNEERKRITEDVVSQHIDMCKVYHSMPQPLQEEFFNYSETTIELIKLFINDDNGEKTKQSDKQLSDEDNMKYSGYYQSLGEILMREKRYEESYDALTEAQILQMRQLASFQKQDGPDNMSQLQLICCLALSATNHLIAAYYRQNGKSQHDLGVILRSNMNLAEDCFKYYPRDPNVIHLITNAALELGEYQHTSRGILAECGTYEKVVRKFEVLYNMKLNQQLAVDLAMLQTKCGHIQADKAIRRYRDAIRNLKVAYQLWSDLAKKTKNPKFKSNAESVRQLIEQLNQGK